MDEINIRTAIKEDLPILYEFEQGIIEYERPFDETLKPDYITYYDIKAMIESSDTEVIVAVYKNEIIASAYIDIQQAKPYLNHSRFAYLGFMYVKPEYRGKGVNKKIVEEIKCWCLEKNIRELRLDVYADNSSAVKAYEKAGFEGHMLNMRMRI